MPTRTQTDSPPFVYPPGSLVPEIVGTWYLGWTKSGAERALAADLAAIGISYYLPMESCVIRTDGHGGRAIGLKPLIPGYVSFCGDDEAPSQARCTGHVAKIVTINFQKRFVDQLFQLQHALGVGPISPWNGPRAGDRCIVTAGRFEGLKGIVVNDNDIRTFTIQLEMMNAAWALDIEPEFLSVIE